jgi:hypothetical protein
VNRESILITPTADLVSVNGRPARLWEGVTADGRRCEVLVAMIGFADQEPAGPETRLLPLRPRLFTPPEPEVFR